MGTGEENPSTLSFLAHQAPPRTAQSSRRRTGDRRGDPVPASARYHGSSQERLRSETSRRRFWIILLRRGPKLVVEEELKKDAARPRTRPVAGNYSSPLSVCRPPSAYPRHGKPLNDTSKTSRYASQQPVEPLRPSAEPNRGVSCASRRIKRGSTYPACLLEVSVFCRRNLHDHVFVSLYGGGGKSVEFVEAVRGGCWLADDTGARIFFFFFSFGVVFLEDGAVIMIVLL